MSQWVPQAISAGIITPVMKCTVGRSVVSLNDRERGAPRLAVVPLIDDAARGVELTDVF